MSIALAKCIFFYNSRKAYYLGTYGVIWVLALAKVHFFGHFWQGLIFLVTAFFIGTITFPIAERYGEASASERLYIILYSMSPSEARAYVLNSLLSLF